MIQALANKLSGFTTTHVRLEPNQGRQTIGPGGTIEFDLPSESVINLDTFTISFEAVATRSDTTGHPSLPAGIEELIEDISCWCGGVRLDSGTGWHGYRNTLMCINMGVVGEALSHPYIQRYLDRATMSTRLIGALEEKRRYMTRNMQGCGFLQSGTIDTSTMPQITVRVTFTTRPVVSVSNNRETINNFRTLAATTPVSSISYVIDNPYCLVECISPGPVYDRLQSSIMGRVGHIPIPFKRYQVFTGGLFESTCRFDVHTRSLDRLYITANSNRTGGPPAIPNAYEMNLAESTNDGEVGLDAERWRTAVNQSIVLDDGHLSVRVAGVQLPAFAANPQTDWYAMTKSNLPAPPTVGVIPYGLETDDFHGYFGNNWLACHRFCSAKSDLRNVSGLDTRGLNLDGVVELTTTMYNEALVIWTESTAELRVMPGREVQLVL
eukprot:scaffold413_cov134-Isochrysis_galbana.AAC.3